MVYRRVLAHLATIWAKFLDLHPVLFVQGLLQFVGQRWVAHGVCSLRKRLTVGRVGIPAWPPVCVAFKAAVAEARRTLAGKSSPSTSAAAYAP